MDAAKIAGLLKQTRLVVGPKRLLAAYGASRLNYQLVSPVDAATDRTRLREGSVLSERPLILTPESLKERFDGFGEEAAEFARWLSAEYRDLLRALEYKFRNQALRARVIHENPAAVVRRIREELASRDVLDTALIECPDAAWSLGVMKLTLDEAARAFPAHLRTYEEHGLFDPGGNALRRRRAEIESLFAAAPADAAARAALGAKLKEYGLFADYEDRYLSLFR